MQKHINQIQVGTWATGSGGGVTTTGLPRNSHRSVYNKKEKMKKIKHPSPNCYITYGMKIECTDHKHLQTLLYMSI